MRSETKSKDLIKTYKRRGIKMYVFDVTNPIILLAVLVMTILLIFLGKEIKKPLAPAFALGFFLILVAIHSIQLGILPAEGYEETRRLLIACLTVDFVFIFISFFGYLWVDDVAAKFYKKKSYDDSLDWFWKKI